MIGSAMSQSDTPDPSRRFGHALGALRRRLARSRPAGLLRRLLRDERGTVAPESPASARRRRARQRNRELLQRELADEAATLRSHPVSLTIDPVTACNLRCPFCPTGGGYTGLKREVLTPERFERVMGHLQVDLLEEAILYNWGEPFLNRNIFDYVAYFRDHEVTTEISSNFSAEDYDDAFFERLVASGLSRLQVSVDGATQESYERYRVRGSLPRVIRNLQRLHAVKRAAGADHPRVIYKMLLNRFNEHEVDAARRIAEDCGAEFLLNERFWCPDELRDEWIASSVLASHEEAIPQGFTSDPGEVVSTYCRQLWDSVIVNSDGAVFPCCLVFRTEHSVGNLVEQDLEAIRNGPRMVSLRRFVCESTASAPDFTNYCENCPSRWCSVKRRPPVVATG